MPAAESGKTSDFCLTAQYMADSINFIRVSKTYDNGVVALDDVSFSVAEGDFVFVIGESGAGKSTIVKLLTREEKASGGRILLNNFDITALYDKHVPFMRRKIGMIFQDYRLIETKTVYENVAFAMEIVGASPRVIARRVPIVLRLVGLRHRADAYPNQLSGGEAQRAGIARAVVNKPKLILADEPTGNLDPVNGESIMAVLSRINHEGTTVLCCTHDIETVRRMHHRVIEFREGALISDSGGGYCSLPMPPKQHAGEVQPNTDLDWILNRTPALTPAEPAEISAATIQDDIDRILARLPRRETAAENAETAADEDAETVAGEETAVLPGDTETPAEDSESTKAEDAGAAEAEAGETSESETAETTADGTDEADA